MGTEFIEAFAAALEQIQNSPRRFARLETSESDREVRRAILHRFNYLIIFEMISDAPNVTAVMHASQQPDSWKHRRTDIEPQ